MTRYRTTAPDDPVRRVAVHCRACGALAADATVDVDGRVHYGPVDRHKTSANLVTGPMMERDDRGRYHRRQGVDDVGFSWACPRCDRQLEIDHDEISGRRARRRVVADLDVDYPTPPR